ncbi:MAG: hypothetical protein HYZ34_00035 [Ignavibacteriae bacterium]|nr:hypothetical protein [Ignavibacteriota bacterium]
MEKHEENFLTMCDGVVELMDNNTDKTGSIPAIGETVEEVRTGAVQAKASDATMDSATDGVASGKQAAENELIKRILIVTGAVFSYARKNNKEELKVKYDVSETKFVRMRDTELGAYVHGMKKEVQEFVDQLVSYGVKQDTLDALDAQTSAYEKLIGGQQAATGLRSGMRTSLTSQIAVLRESLESLDGLMLQMQEPEPDFYNTYIATRVIKDLGTRHLPEEPTPPPTA